MVWTFFYLYARKFNLKPEETMLFNFDMIQGVYARIPALRSPSPKRLSTAT